MNKSTFTNPVEEIKTNMSASIDKQTESLPSDVFLWAAIGALALSLMYDMSGKKEQGSSIRKWLPTLVTLGSYNRMLQSSNPVSTFGENH